MLYSVNKPVTKEAKGSQLTIFYGGEVIVFDDIPADKAKEIMSFASKGSISQSHSNYAYTLAQSHPSSFPSPNVVRSFATPSTPFPFMIPSSGNNSVEEHPQAQSRPVVCGNFFRSLVFQMIEDLCHGLCFFFF